MDSAEIAKYLDDEYPESPAVLPEEVRAYQVGPIHTLFTLWRKSDVQHLDPQAAFDHVFWEFAGTALLPLFIYRQLALL